LRFVWLWAAWRAASGRRQVVPNDTEGNPTKRPEGRDDVVAKAVFAFEKIRKKSVCILWDC
jgi:hypothetical protein